MILSIKIIYILIYYTRINMELKGAIDGDFNIDGFNQQELLDMYNFICCN